MGCFSYVCQICGDPVNSDSFSGEHVKLFLLKEGKVIEKLSGQYDSYGRVFDENMKSIEWKMDWTDVCDLEFSKDKSNGIAAIHTDCFDGTIPIERSESDPDQGWGEYKHSTDGTNNEG